MGARLASEPTTFKRNGAQIFKFPPKKSVIVDLRLDIAAFCLLNGLQITAITFVNNIDSRESCGLLSLCPTSKLFWNIPPYVTVGLSNFLNFRSCKSKVKAMARVCATVWVCSLCAWPQTCLCSSTTCSPGRSRPWETRSSLEKIVQLLDLPCLARLVKDLYIDLFQKSNK